LLLRQPLAPAFRFVDFRDLARAAASSGKAIADAQVMRSKEELRIG
jgi:hypothetical protein